MVSNQMIPKTPTGIAGIDQILQGGIPAGRTTVLVGGPGSGKTILGLEFLGEGALTGEPGIFLGFEEDAAAVRRNAAALGRDLEALERDGKLIVCVPRVEPSAVLAGEFDLRGLLAILDGQARAIGARRIVVDSLDVLLRVFDNLRRERNELVALNDWLLEKGLTSILTLKDSEQIAGRYDFLEYVADCVVRLDQRVQGQITTRRLRVLKCRGSGFARNEYPYIIDDTGIHLLPITRMILAPAYDRGRASSGNESLDRILGGGYLSGSAILLTGRTGTGKTTLAMTFVRSACARGERVLYLSFEESDEGLVGSVLSAGLDLGPALASGTFRIHAILPEATGSEAHLFEALRLIREHDPVHVVVDSISACLRMGSEQAAFDYVMRLSCACKAHGRTALLINQQGGTNDDTITGMGLSSLIDTVVQLGLREQNACLERDLLVTKSRGTRHSLRRHPFRITDAGIEFDAARGGGV
jgi:circadian clock protein KaiC